MASKSGFSTITQRLSYAVFVATLVVNNVWGSCTSGASSSSGVPRSSLGRGPYAKGSVIASESATLAVGSGASLAIGSDASLALGSATGQSSRQSRINLTSTADSNTINDLTTDGFTANANPTGVVIGSVTVHSGSGAVTAASDTPSPAPSGSGNRVGGTRSVLPSPIAPSDHRQLSTDNIRTIGSLTATKHPYGFVVGSVTVPRSSPVVTLGSDTVYHAASGGTLVSDGSRSLVSTSIPVKSQESDGSIIISTSTTIEDGQTYPAPVILDGSAPPITLPPSTTTIASQEASRKASSVSTGVLHVISAIHSWKHDTETSQEDTLNKVKPIVTDVDSFISDLGGGSTSGGCGGSLISRLFCISRDLHNIENGVKSDTVDVVDSALTDLTSQNDNLSDENKSNSSGSRSSQSRTESSSQSRSSSCTSTITATDVTVLCSPTVSSAGTSIITTQTCSPVTTIFTTGCDVTGTTVTFTSTASKSKRTPCASDTCGQLCPMGDGPLSGAPMNAITRDDSRLIPTIITNTYPTASFAPIISGSYAKRNLGDVHGIKTVTKVFTRAVSQASQNMTVDGYTNMRSATLAERALPSPYPGYVNTIRPRWIEQTGLVHGQWFDYPNDPGVVGVNGMYGCTSVIVVSDKGVFISHIWENPVFIDRNFVPTSDAQFGNVLLALRDGTADCQPLSGLIGTDNSPGPLNQKYHPRVWVMTPFALDTDPEVGSPTELLYHERAYSLLHQVAGILPGRDVAQSVIGYIPTNREESTRIGGTAGRAIIEFDPREREVVNQNGLPGSQRFQIGAWRLWVEDREIVSQDVLWAAIDSRDTKIRRDAGYMAPE
ncbi:MAG: hypothetical protein M1828_007029 [Chrysothrix sp. TS-e1954]|nr:MAG: hypothetical protein M1828_007029 [Chrysothrix sp. TS-e1954]